MICPVDKGDMIVVEHESIELDYCTKCSGVWFDSGELELLFESMGMDTYKYFLDSVLQSAEARSPEKKRKCPICREHMKKAVICSQPEVMIDACLRGDGLWFDGGEVGQLLTQLGCKPSGEGSEQRITGFLREVFKTRG